MRTRKIHAWITRVGYVVLPVLLLTACRTRTQGPSRPSAPQQPSEVTRHIPDYRGIDHRPYEFIWAQREPDQEQLLDFERLLGWRVESGEGVSAGFERSQQFQLWDDYVGEFVFRSAISHGWVRLWPPEPIIVRDPVDTFTLWVRGPEHMPDPEDAPHLTVHFAEANGNPVTLPLGAINWTGWRLLHRPLPRSLSDSVHYPISLTHLSWTHLPSRGQEATYIYLDGLTLFLDQQSPLRFAARPQRPLPLSDGQLRGLNTGGDELPFPVTASAILPGNRSSYDIARVPDSDSYELVSESSAGRLAFRLHPESGITPIDILWNGAPTGLRVADVSLMDWPYEKSAPLVVRVEGAQLYVEYEQGETYRLSMFGSSLLIDVACRGRDASGLRWHLEAESDIDEVLLPYLHGAHAAMPPLLARRLETGTAVFAQAYADPYRSNASTWKRVDDDPQSVQAIYHPHTAGRRNDVHERLIISVSTHIEDVLPTIPNPPGGASQSLAGRILLDGLDFEDGYGAQRAWIDQCVALGMRDVLQIMPRTIWRMSEESDSFRVRANPHRGGDATLQEYVQDAQRAGWSVALLTGLRYLHPLNAFWSPDLVARRSDRSWTTDGGAAYLAKAPYAFSWMEQHAAELMERFHADAFYLDRHTDQAPWEHTDYDHRVPGAATWSQVLFTDGELLDETSRTTDRPVLAQAEGLCWYAGLADGLVERRNLASRGDLSFNPLYKLTRAQELAVVFGAGPFAEGAADEAGLDAYLAAQIAYGNAGRLYPKWERPDLVARSYYAMRALQERYLLHAPIRILYEHQGSYHPPSAAFANRAWKSGRLYKQYAGDVEVWVNGSAQAWRVRSDLREFILPPDGWLAVAPGFTALSASIDGRRIDYVVSDSYTYLDPRGAHRAYGHLRASGPVVLQMATPDTESLTVYDIQAVGDVAVHSDVVWPFTASVVRCFDARGQVLGDADVTRDGAWWVLSGPAGTVRYELNSADKTSR